MAKQLKIGKINFSQPTILSPMAALTDFSFRKLIDEIGGVGLMVSEMVSAEGIRRRNERTLCMLKDLSFTTPQFIQLFGSEPQPLVEAVAFVENETSFNGIDINMGCPASKIVKKGAGAALLKEPLKIAAIVRAVRRQSSLPLTVKIRLGYDTVNVFDIIPVLEAEGVDAVAVHFRLKSASYGTAARWEYARQIKDCTKLCVLGNGDIFTAQQARERLETVDGVLLGRGAIMNPFIFSEIAGVNPNISDSKLMLKRLVDLIETNYEPHLQLGRLKAYLRYFFSHKPNVKQIRQNLYSCTSFTQAKDQLKLGGFI